MDQFSEVGAELNTVCEKLTIRRQVGLPASLDVALMGLCS